jgi:hypothetical protein
MQDNKMTLEMRVLRRGVELFGSVRALAQRLHVAQADLTDWLDGTRTPAQVMLVLVMDLLIEQRDVAGLGQLHSLAPNHSDGIDFQFGSAALNADAKP